VLEETTRDLSALVRIARIRDRILELVEKQTINSAAEIATTTMATTYFLRSRSLCECP
jgi:hypothetical protein